MNFGFVETSFWVALFRSREAHHNEAKNIWGATELTRVTTSHVVEELWTFLRKKEGHGAAMEVVRTIRNEFAVWETTDRLRESAWEFLFARGTDRVFSYIDALSFEVMRANKIRYAFAFDGDFSAAGFVELRESNVV